MMKMVPKPERSDIKNLFYSPRDIMFVLVVVVTIASSLVVGRGGGVDAFLLNGGFRVDVGVGSDGRRRRRPSSSSFSAPSSSIPSTARGITDVVAVDVDVPDVGYDDSGDEDDYGKRSLISPENVSRISGGGVVVIPDWMPIRLVRAMREDARNLFEDGQFRPDGLTNTALREQGFDAKADRQTFRGGADWDDYGVGDGKARLEFAIRMGRLREELAIGLNRPTLSDGGRGEGEGGGKRHEMTYNWYEPGAKLGRHLDEHHEETKGTKGWIRPSRRSVTWLVYLNENWNAEDGGALRCYPRSEGCISTNDVQVGAHDGNLQVGWVTGMGGEEVDGGILRQHPVFLDCFRPSGGAALYRVAKSSSSGDDETRIILSVHDFDVPPQPIDFASFLVPDARDAFEQISTSRVDPRFVRSPIPLADGGAGKAGGVDEMETATTTTTTTTDAIDRVGASGEIIGDGTFMDVTPAAGTLVLFDSVTLPHMVMEVTGSRQRIAATGWFHEDSQFVLEV
jgi:hypothetical protein